MITDDVWALCGLLLQVATTWGYDYVQDCIAPLLNYVSKVHPTTQMRTGHTH